MNPEEAAELGHWNEAVRQMSRALLNSLGEYHPDLVLELTDGEYDRRVYSDYESEGTEEHGEEGEDAGRKQKEGSLPDDADNGDAGDGKVTKEATSIQEKDTDSVQNEIASLSEDVAQGQTASTSAGGEMESVASAKASADQSQDDG